jgi:class 3 adenylate cyclase
MMERRPTTVLFVDVVGSTELAATIGDGPWAQLLEGYKASSAASSRPREGRRWTPRATACSRSSPTRADAVSFGCSLRGVVEPLGLRLRVGVHTGTCWVVGDKCTGLEVSIGARVVDAAAPDEVLVSGPVRKRLSSDGRFAFHERGRFELKGAPGRWSLSAVESRGGGGFDDNHQ